jgi:hypothetical protein
MKTALEFFTNEEIARISSGMATPIHSQISPS